MRDAAGRDLALGLAVERGLARELLGAERDQVALVAEALARLRHCLDQFAVGGEDRRRPLEIGEQAVRALGQAQILAGALGRHHQDGGAVVGERDARAQADQRAAEAGAEAAQPFQPRRAALRQRAGKPRDLRGGRMLGRRSAGCRQRAGRSGVEDRGGDRIGPEDARWRPRSTAIPATGSGHAPRAADRSDRLNWNSVPLIALVARITANESLIRPLWRRVHDAGAAIRAPIGDNLNDGKFPDWRARAIAS